MTRQWFDCTPPVVISRSAPSARARAATISIFRTLFPPNPNEIASSRLTSRRGPPPSAARSRDGVFDRRRVVRERHGGHAAQRGRAPGGPGVAWVRIVYSRNREPVSRHAERSAGWSSPPSSARPAPSWRPPTAWTPGSTPITRSARSRSRQTFVFLTDSAVGVPEEDNLRHLIVNLGDDAPLDRVVPFLTSKHPLDYCLAYADRASQHGFESLVVLGGDQRVGVPRSVEHAWQLRRQIRGADRRPGAGRLGQPVPRRGAAGGLPRRRPTSPGEFFLTQVVSHHDPAPGRAVPERGRSARRDGSRACSACSTTAARTAADAVGPAGLHPGAGGRRSRASSTKARRRRRSARGRFER